MFYFTVCFPSCSPRLTSIFFDENNFERNIAKQEALTNTSVVKLQANTGYSFLVPMAIHNSSICKGLDRGMRIQIIVQNPWSVNAILTLLRKNDFNGDREYTSYLSNRLPVDRLMEAYLESHWLNERLNVCFKYYLKLKKAYPKQIELRLSNRVLSNSILLTDSYLFFEPYISMLEMDKKDIAFFEIQIPNNNALYTETNDYFDKLWKTSYKYHIYKKSEHLLRQQVKNYFEKEAYESDS